MDGSRGGTPGAIDDGMKMTLPNLPSSQPVTVHVSTRVIYDLDMLVPYPDVNAGIIHAVAHTVCMVPTAQLHALTCLPNHMDMIFSAPASLVKKFVGDVKRGITRRLRQLGCPMKGTFWHDSVVTPLNSADEQLRALEYVLARGVEEGMVKKPTDWRGVTCVDTVTTGKLLSEGSQFVGFAFLDFFPLPALAHHTPAQQQLMAQDMVEKITKAGPVAHPTIGLVRNEKAFAEALRKRFAGETSGLRLVA